MRPTWRMSNVHKGMRSTGHQITENVVRVLAADKLNNILQYTGSYFLFNLHNLNMFGVRFHIQGTKPEHQGFKWPK